MILLKIIWFILPAGIANMAPEIMAKILPSMDKPLDFGKKFRGKRIFGDHKTIRGLVSGILAGGAVFLIQIFLVKRYNLFSDLSMFEYVSAPIYLGFLLGFGALAGDAIKSFFKRQVGIKSGKSWIPFDQIDWILGAISVFYLFVAIDIFFVFGVLVFGFVLHLFMNFVGYVLKLDDKII